MPKISGNSLEKFNKSCITLHQESSKIKFAYFRVFHDFLEILQESAIWLHYWRCTFTPRTLQRTKASQPCPWFTEKPSERLGGLQCGPWPWRRRGSAKSGEAGGAPGRVGAQGGGHAHLGLAGTRSLGGKTPYNGARRWPVVMAAVPWLRRVKRTGWTTSDARGTKGSYGQRPSDWVTRTSWD
jgi:hypothetical protein